MSAWLSGAYYETLRTRANWGLVGVGKVRAVEGTRSHSQSMAIKRRRIKYRETSGWVSQQRPCSRPSRYTSYCRLSGAAADIAESLAIEHLASRGLERDDDLGQLTVRAINRVFDKT